MKSPIAGRSRRLQKMKRRRALHTVWLCVLLLAVAAGICFSVVFMREHRVFGVDRPYNVLTEFPTTGFGSDFQTTGGFAENLCVGDSDVALDGVTLPEEQNGALFNLDTHEVLFAQHMYDKLYPASMTKIMTALLALEKGNMDDIVTISSSALNLEDGSQVCGFHVGDQISLGKLVDCLLVYSGNDAAAAIAEHIGGTQEEFVSMMNERAYELGMTGTHFTNPHGLQDEEHYTTAYDIYLMLNEAMKNQQFLSIIQQSSYTVSYDNEEGRQTSITLESTDHYLTGEATPPKGVTILGGKTGTTSNAGNCLALISQNEYGTPFISVVSNSPTKDQLYVQMNMLLEKIHSGSS